MYEGTVAPQLELGIFEQHRDLLSTAPANPSGHGRFAASIRATRGAAGFRPQINGQPATIKAASTSPEGMELIPGPVAPADSWSPRGNHFGTGYYVRCVQNAHRRGRWRWGCSRTHRHRCAGTSISSANTP